MATVLLVPGSTRSGSSNVAALRAARDAAPDDVRAELFEGLREALSALAGRGTGRTAQQS